MVAATGAIGTASTPAVRSTGGLDAQLARYEKQLAECVHCASARTPQGKQAIDDLYGKIHDIKAKLEEARNAGPVQPVAAAEHAAPADAAARDKPAASGQAPRRASAYDTVGSVIDVYG